MTHVPSGLEIAHTFLDLYYENDPSLRDCHGGPWVSQGPGNSGTWFHVAGTIDMDYLMSFCLDVTTQHEEGGSTVDSLFVWVQHTDVDVEWLNEPHGFFDGEPFDGYRVLHRWVQWTEGRNESYVEQLQAGTLRGM